MPPRRPVAPLPAAPIARIPCQSCHTSHPQTDYGVRRDGQVHTRCPSCRSAAATRASHVAWRSDLPPDEKALRVVERWCGFPYRQWPSAAAREWQLRRRVWLEDVWTHRMIRLRDRARRIADRRQPKAGAA